MRRGPPPHYRLWAAFRGIVYLLILSVAVPLIPRTTTLGWGATLAVIGLLGSLGMRWLYRSNHGLWMTIRPSVVRHLWHGRPEVKHLFSIVALGAAVCMPLTSLSVFSVARGYGLQFVAGQSALQIPFELEGNVILLRVSVNGSSALTFILDTGAYSIINTRHARELGLSLQTVGKTDSIGAEPQDVHVVTSAVSIGLPGVSLSGKRLLAISLDKVQECIDLGSSESNLGGPAMKRIVLDGILGKEFFASFVVEIDYAARRLDVFDPGGYKYGGKGTSFPIEVAPQHIFVKAQVQPEGRLPITAKLLVDTGASTALRLTKQFTETHKLLPPAETLTATPECGLGGIAKEKAWEGRLEALHLGDFIVSRPVTVFSRLSTPENHDGFLGGLALRNFKVIFDYSRSRRSWSGSDDRVPAPREHRGTRPRRCESVLRRSAGPA